MEVVKKIFVVIWWIVKWPLKLVGIILNSIVEGVGNCTLHTGFGDVKPLAIIKLFAPLTRLLAQL